MLGRGVRPERRYRRGDRGDGAGGRPARRAGDRPCMRRLRRGAGAAVPRRAARGARQRSRRPGLQQRGHRRRRAASSATAGEEWERTFAIDWWGVYYCARAFLPLLIASGDGVLVNTSSVNGLWASLGPGMPNTAYSAAKFAVRGFTEALIEDLRVQRAARPGRARAAGARGHQHRRQQLPRPRPAGPEHMSEAQLQELIPRDVQAGLIRAGVLAKSASADDLRQMLVRVANPTSGTRRRSARRRRRPSSSTACGPGPGGSSSARTPR